MLLDTKILYIKTIKMLTFKYKDYKYIHSQNVRKPFILFSVFGWKGERRVLVMVSEVVTLLVGLTNGLPSRARSFNLQYNSNSKRCKEEGRKKESGGDKIKIWKEEGKFGRTIE